MHADVTRGAVWCSLLALAQAFYVPGFSIKSYHDGETIPLFVNKVFSDHSELQYAYTELPFVCPPSGRVHGGSFTSGASLSLNLGEVLRGDRITVSDYELVMGQDEEDRLLCNKPVDVDGVKRAMKLISNGYMAEWIVDNLPGATPFQTTDKSRKYYAAGFKIGEEVVHSTNAAPRYCINNHVTIVIRYRPAPGKDGEAKKKVIVGFEVFPKSIGNGTGLLTNMDDITAPLELEAVSQNSTGESEGTDHAMTIPYTYSVYFREEPNLEWQNRWDMYFLAQDYSENVHWLAIVNSLVISGLLTTVVAVIVTRTVYGDINIYNRDEGKKGRPSQRSKPHQASGGKTEGLLGQLGDTEGDADISDDEETLEDSTGWKLVHGDVFRTPAYGGLLAPLIGSGVQLTFMAIGLLILSALGVLNPSFRGGYASVGVGLFVFAGLFSGYYSSRLYKTFGGQLWQKNVFVTASLLPGLLFSIVFILNLFVWVQASSTALPFGTLLGLVCLWLFIQLPLVYIGGRYGFVNAGAWTHPIKANAIPRRIPPQTWYTKSFQVLLLSGFIPFAVIFIELLFVFKSLWQDKSGYYYVFGFLAVVSIILLVTVIEVSIVATYVQLCNENYHWWWQSFIVGGSSSIWIFGYLVWYYFTKLHITGFVSSLLFFSYGFLACGVYALLTGTVGWVSAYIFVRSIYSAIKVD